MLKSVFFLYVCVSSVVNNLYTNFYIHTLFRKGITLCSIYGTLAGYCTQNCTLLICCFNESILLFTLYFVTQSAKAHIVLFWGIFIICYGTFQNKACHVLHAGRCTLHFLHKVLHILQRP